MKKNKLLYLFLPILLLILTACQKTETGENPINVRIFSDGLTYTTSMSRGVTVLSTIDSIPLSIGQLDTITPPTYTILTEDTDIYITRVVEEYKTQTQVIPYERQVISNESMSAGESRLIQSGEDGLGETVVRLTYEDGILSSETIVSESLKLPPISEIIMVGVQNPFTPVSINGKIAYLTSGNAWIMEESTANRHPLATTGDLDGRIFSLSPDGEWLLFSRTPPSQENTYINSLWLVNTSGAPQIIELGIKNIIHFAEWQPGRKYAIGYSTVEPRSTAPGWQANNDLYLLSFNPQTMKIDSTDEIIDSSSGGVYGWWGTNYIWSPDGEQIAYARPDEIGLVDQDNHTLVPLINITPYNTYADWAWVPWLTWGRDMKTLFYVNHAFPTDLSDPEDSPYFDLQAYSLISPTNILLAQGVGMFSYPIISQIYRDNDQAGYQIACLQAIFPMQSTTSRYRVMIMDSDGSESNIIFPADTQTGLSPQLRWGTWNPSEANKLLALIYDGNIWLIDTANQRFQQITGDGLTSKIDWK